MIIVIISIILSILLTTGFFIKYLLDFKEIRRHLVILYKKCQHFEHLGDEVGKVKMENKRRLKFMDRLDKALQAEHHLRQKL
jgi:hypothetical protein